MEPSSQPDITFLLRAWAEGDRDALNRLTPLVYEELRRRAHHYMASENAASTLQATALVNEAFLQLAGANRIRWQDRAHFFAVSSQVMRHILVSAARKRRAGKRGGAIAKIDLNESIDAMPDRGHALIALDDALTALGQFDERRAKVVELRFFGGLTSEETAKVLGISEPSVRRDWKLARAWLMDQMNC